MIIRKISQRMTEMIKRIYQKNRKEKNSNIDINKRTLTECIIPQFFRHTQMSTTRMAAL